MSKEKYNKIYTLAADGRNIEPQKKRELAKMPLKSIFTPQLYKSYG